MISRTLHYVARLTCVIHCDSRGLRLASSNRRSKAWLWSWKSVPSRCYGASGWLHDVTWAYGLGRMTWSQLSPSYLQVISKLSPSHPVIRPFLLTSKGTTPTLVFEGVNMCERCRADVLLVIFTVVCWQLHIFSVSSMMFHAYQGRVQRIAFFNIFQGLNGLNLQAIPVTRQDCSHIMVGGNRSSAPIAPGSWCSWWQWVSRDTVSLNVRCKQLIAADSSCSFCWKLTGGFLYFRWASFMHLTNVGS